MARPKNNLNQPQPETTNDIAELKDVVGGEVFSKEKETVVDNKTTSIKSMSNILKFKKVDKEVKTPDNGKLFAFLPPIGLTVKELINANYSIDAPYILKDTKTILPAREGKTDVRYTSVVNNSHTLIPTGIIPVIPEGYSLIVKISQELIDCGCLLFGGEATYDSSFGGEIVLRVWNTAPTNVIIYNDMPIANVYLVKSNAVEFEEI